MRPRPRHGRRVPPTDSGSFFQSPVPDIPPDEDNLPVSRPPSPIPYEDSLLVSRAPSPIPYEGGPSVSWAPSPERDPPVSRPPSPVPSFSSSFHLGNAGRQTWKLYEDSWSGNPPQVKSYLAYSTASGPGPMSEDDSFTATSLSCGFGWHFRFDETFHYLKSDSNPRIKELIGRVNLILEPNLCSSMPLSNVKVNVKVAFPSDRAKATQESRYTDVSLRSVTQIGTYTKPSGYEGQLHFEITLVFSDSDGLSLPTTSSTNTRKALRYSLDGPSFVDTKFYLLSSRVQGRPARPRAVFANSMLLKDCGTYLHDLLSSSGFANGTPCDLYEDTAKEIAKLDVNAYDYDSDSDLEGESDDEVESRHLMATLPSKIDKDSESDAQLEEPANGGVKAARAFAINGTAHKTWKAFLYYCYTNDIRFSALRSRPNISFAKLAQVEDPDIIQCSPKSMYRFADYANLPELMSLAKEAIQNNLSQSNIVAELFSRFTSKYQEIIDLEISYLVDSFSSHVAREFDEMLEKIVAGSMPHCGQVLKLTIKELRAANSKGPQVSFFGGQPKPPVS